MLDKWLDEASSELPGCDNALFTNVWIKNSLIFNDKDDIWDSVDYYNARMIAATLKAEERLLITLPDLKPHRPAFLLANALLRYFLDLYPQKDVISQQVNPVLYFGANIGIREHLNRTSIKGLRIDFARIFNQQDISRGATNIDLSIPQQTTDSIIWLNVITVYSPADPIEILKSSRPPWIAIDCSDANSLAWLKPLLQEAERLSIPVIAWSLNPLSECVDDFSKTGNIFYWPPLIQPTKHNTLYELLSSFEKIQIEPSIIANNNIDQLCDLLRKIRSYLSKLSNNPQINGRFERDAISIHWKYLITIEALAVPLDFYEAEATRFWGLQSINKISDTCRYFREIIVQNNLILIKSLDYIGELLEKCRSLIECHGSFLWEACINYCLDDSENKVPRILVFQSENRKKIFLLALLAKLNTTEDDLRDLSVYVTSFKELAHKKNKTYKIEDNDVMLPEADLRNDTIPEYTIVGLPSTKATPQMLFTLLHKKVNIILYPHQYSAFLYRESDWSERLGGNIRNNINTISNLSGKFKIPDKIQAFDRIHILDPVVIDIDTAKKTKKSSTDLWRPKDITTEVDWLFRTETEDEDNLTVNHSTFDENADTTQTIDTIWCSEAIRVNFDQEWVAYYDQSDSLNVIINTGLNLRYIRSLRINDRVLVIHGQHRQSLYDLIISRVHKHPSIELDISLIRRWQEEIKGAYTKWVMTSVNQSEYQEFGWRGLEGLLRRMNAKGSHRYSSQTMNNWISGNVLSPDDIEDLRRVAEILDISFVKQYYKYIYKAALRLAGIHRSLSIKLNRWLQDKALGRVHKNEDDVIDEQLGLTFEDIKNSLLLLRIINIQNVQGPFLKSSLGQIEKEENCD